MPRNLTSVFFLIAATAVYGQDPALFPEGKLQSTTLDFRSFDAPSPRLINAELLALTPASYHGHPEFGVLPFNAQCTNCIELIHKRTVNSRYFIEPGTGGSVFYVQQSYGELHYQDKPGRWVTIDSRLRPHAEKEQVYHAPKQELPITLNVKDNYTSMVLENGFELKFNYGVEMTGHLPGRDVLFTHRSSTYTAGKDGMINIGRWKDVDREIRVGRGEVKTSYIIREPLEALSHSDDGYLSFSEVIKLPSGYRLERVDGNETRQGWWFGELALYDEQGVEIARLGRPHVYDDSKTQVPATEIPIGYRVSESTTGFVVHLLVDLLWLNDSNRVYPIVVDPLVSGSNTYNSGQMGFAPDGSCWNESNYCSYAMSVTVPGMSTLTDAFFSAAYTSLSNGCAPGVHCLQSQAAFRIYGLCDYSPGSGFYWTCLPPCSSPGTTSGSGLPLFNTVSCQSPQCPDHVMNFSMRTYHCSCSTPSCATSCHYMPNNSWSITIQARTVESSATTVGPSTICEGQNTTLSGSGYYGVPGYSYTWNPGALTGQVVTVSPTTTTTYTLTVTDACSNTSTSTVTVTVRPRPLLTMSSTDVSCFGGNNGTATVSASGGTTFTYSWNSSPPQNTATATNLPAGTYTVTVTNNFGCQNTGSVTVNQPASAVSASIGGVNHVTCFGGTNGSALASGSGGTPGYTYSWNTIPPQNTATASGLSAGTYTVTVTDANGCPQTASVNITQPSDLSLSTSVSHPGCFGASTGSATVTPSGGVPGYTYAWNTIPPQSTSIAIGLSAGSYTVTVTDANGCEKTASVNLVDPPDLILNISSTNASCPASADGTATVIASGGTPGYTYIWSTVPPQSISTAIGLNAGPYSVTVTDNNGCQKIASVTVGANAAMTLNISTTDVSCNGGNDGTATVTVGGGSAPYTYSWNTTPPQSTPTATNLPAGNHTVTVTDASGCQQTELATITEPSPFSVTMSSTDVSCNSGADGTATATVSGATPPYTYVWNTTPPQVTSTATGLGVGTYTVTITDSEGCQTVQSVAVTQPSVMTIGTSVTNVSCFGLADGTAAVTVSGGSPPYGYVWNTIPPQNASAATNLAAGTYTVTISDNAGCNETATVAITEPPAINVTITATDISCFGNDDGQATAAPSGGTLPYTYTWSTTPTQSTPTATNLGPGSYSVTVADANGCMVTMTTTITEPTQLLVSMSSVAESCSGAANGSATATVSGGTPPYSYLWNTSPSQSTATASALAQGSYTVTVTDARGCTEVATVTVDADNSLDATLIPFDATCFGYPDGWIDVTAVGGASPYTFNWSNGSLSEDLVDVPAGDYVVTVTDVAGCAVIRSATIGQPTAMTVSAGADRSLEYGESVVLNAVVSPPGTYSFSWEPTVGLSAPMSSSTSAAPPVTTVYTVTATDVNGCSAQDDIRIEVMPPVEMTLPTAFTPNDDGLNDVFFDPFSIGVEIVSMRIFNRWGDNIYEGTAPWDGTARGKDQPIGSYVYDVTVRMPGTTMELTFSGNVTLLR